MNEEQKSLTQKKFPILFSLALEYAEDDENDIRTFLRNKPTLLDANVHWNEYESALQVLSEEDRNYLIEKLRKKNEKRRPCRIFTFF